MYMSRRTFLTASVKVVLSVTIAGSLRVARAHGINAVERPWSAAPEAMSADPRIRAMAYAILAPNCYNLQPWLAELPGDDLLILRCDLSRRLPQADPHDRRTVITFGNFLELLRMAAAQEGYLAAIEQFPMGEPLERLDGRPIASVRFTRGGAVADPLFAQAVERRTCKRPFEPQPVADAVLQQLCSAGNTAACFRASNDMALVGQVRNITSEAFAIEKRTARINLEGVRITRIGHDEVEASPDGIDLQGEAVEVALDQGALSRGLLANAHSPASERELEAYRMLCNTAQAYVWLSTAGNTRRDQLGAGRNWLRVHLKATELGLSFMPQSSALNDYAEMARLFQEMHTTLKVPSGSRLQMVGRLGYAAQMPPSPRWPVETKILNV
jgi:hypothetical protein